MAAWLGGAHVVGVNSGTDALVLALRQLNLQQGDEVVLPSYTFFACFEAVVSVGATPVLCDSAPDDFQATAFEVSARLTSRTKGVIAVPLFGDASALPSIAQLCRMRGVTLIVDAAQAFGASVRLHDDFRVPAVSCGDLGTLSFYPTKTLGAIGDGGALICKRSTQAQRARALRNHGLMGGVHSELGYNTRLDALQAEVLTIGLSLFDVWQTRRQAIADRYIEELSDLPGVLLPIAREGHAWNYFVVRCTWRDELAGLLAGQGIETKVYYERPIHEHPAAAGWASGETLPFASAHARQALALPLFPGMRDEEVALVISAVRGACAAINEKRR